MGETLRHHGPVALLLHPVGLWRLALVVIRPLLWLECYGAARALGDGVGQLQRVLYRSRP